MIEPRRLTDDDVVIGASTVDKAIRYIQLTGAIRVAKALRDYITALEQELAAVKGEDAESLHRQEDKGFGEGPYRWGRINLGIGFGPYDSLPYVVMDVHHNHLARVDSRDVAILIIERMNGTERKAREQA